MALRCSMGLGLVAAVVVLGACAPLDRGPQLPQAVPSAGQALARELGLTADALQLISLSPEQWSDTCLGLPQAGEACEPAVVPGWRITFNVYGESYVYRADLGGNDVRMEPTGGE